MTQLCFLKAQKQGHLHNLLDLKSVNDKSLNVIVKMKRVSLCQCYIRWVHRIDLELLYKIISK